MSDFRFGKALRIARRPKASLKREDRLEPLEDARRRMSEQRLKIKSKRREISRIRKELDAASDGAERSVRMKRKKRAEQELFELESLAKEWAKNLRQQRQQIQSKRRQLKQMEAQQVELKQIKKGILGTVKGWTERIKLWNEKKTAHKELLRLKTELRAANERMMNEPQMGALPDFVIIGVKKGGTTFLYHLLNQHPLVEPAAAKELYFFGNLFDKGVEWYRSCFPAPRLKYGRKTITGEATPYMYNRRAAKRMAGIIPQARLIALLRNPVDRAYSDFQQGVRKGRETRSFEEAVGLKKARSVGREEETPEAEVRPALEDNSEYISRSIYVDQLQYWSEFFDKKQLLVLKSEEFFERPQETLKVVLDFLDLPEWEPQALEPRDEPNKEKYERTKVNKGRYEQEMDPATRLRLEEYFEAHNRRLYDYLGVDFAW